MPTKIKESSTQPLLTLPGYDEADTGPIVGVLGNDKPRVVPADEDCSRHSEHQESRHGALEQATLSSKRLS